MWMWVIVVIVVVVEWVLRWRERMNRFEFRLETISL